MTDPVSGPIPRDQFVQLVSAPHGEAIKLIRRYDPLYGRQEGEKIPWKVTLRREIPEVGTATVMAATEEEANALAQNLTEAEIDWDVASGYWGDCDGTIESVEPGEGRAPVIIPSAHPLFANAEPAE